MTTAAEVEEALQFADKPERFKPSLAGVESLEVVALRTLAAEVRRLRAAHPAPTAVGQADCPVCGKGPVTASSWCRSCDSEFCTPEQLDANKAAIQGSKPSE